MGFVEEVRSFGIHLIADAIRRRRPFQRPFEFPQGAGRALGKPTTKGPEGHEGGFTLIELLIVIAIIMTLAGIALPVYSNQINKTKTFKAISDIRTVEKEIDLYKESQGALPANLGDIGRGNLLDPWGRPYQYLNHSLIPPGQRRKYHNTVPLNLDYDLFSMGSDGVFKPPLTAQQSRDDIIRADDGGYVGPASEY